MKILRLNLINFIPYFEDSNEIILFDDKRSDRNVTLNIGPTGNGKTSISRAIMWCLFGENYESRWESMINDLSIDVTKEAREKSVKMNVEMDVEIEGDVYHFVRSGIYDIVNGKKTENFSVLLNGEPVDDPIDLVNKKFLPRDLMEYFIFDADDMLNLFEKNQEKTIRDHINKIVGVETLDLMSEALSGVMLLYQNEINDIKGKSPGVSQELIDKEKRKKTEKDAAIDKLKKDITHYNDEKKKLLPKGLSPDDLRLKEIMDKVEVAKDAVNKLTNEFENYKLDGDKPIISTLFLLFLKDIIGNTILSLNRTSTTRNEFESAINILKSTLGDKYSGLVLHKDVRLLKNNIDLKESMMDTVDKLDLRDGTGIKVDALQELNESKERCIQIETKFAKLKEDFLSAMRELADARNQLKQIGETEQNKERKSAIDKFLEYDEKIKELYRTIGEIEVIRDGIQKNIEHLEKARVVTAEDEEEIKEVGDKISKVVFMQNVVNKAKRQFLRDLLGSVNKRATEFFRGVVRGEDKRLDSVIVDSDYKLNVITQERITLEPKQISKGNTQIALMAFFFGLSQHLKNKLPYVIDDPLIRLDIGHDKRLIEHLCSSGQQIIMHMIPGKEYTRDSFEWLKPYINTQNWINRQRGQHSLGKLRSRVERKEHTKFVEYDIDKL